MDDVKLCVKFNSSEDHEGCAVCHGDLVGDHNPRLFVEGTGNPVCEACGREHAPALALFVWGRDLKKEFEEAVTEAIRALQVLLAGTVTTDDGGELLPSAWEHIGNVQMTVRAVTCLFNQFGEDPFADD